MKANKLLILGVVLAVLFLGKGWMAKTAVSSGVRAVTGLDLSIQKMDVGIFRTRLRVTRMTLKNPKGFPDPVMVKIPEFYVDYDLPALLRGKVHLRELKLNLEEFVVVKNEAGKLNLDSLRSVQKAKEQRKTAKKKQGARPTPFQIDRLHLKVGKVIFKDYSKVPPSVREFNVNIDEHYQNITDPVALGSLIVARVLIRTTVANLTGFDVGALEGYAREILQSSREVASQVLQEVGKLGSQAVDSIKNILPFGKE